MRPRYDPKMAEYDAETIGQIKRRLAHADERDAGGADQRVSAAAAGEAAKTVEPAKDDAPVELAPGPQAPQPGWWTRQKVSGRHAGGAAQERSAEGGGPSASGSPRPDGVNRGP